MFIDIIKVLIVFFLFMFLIGIPFIWAVWMSFKVIYPSIFDPMYRRDKNDLRIVIATFCLFSLYGFAISFYFLFDHWINL